MVNWDEARDDYLTGQAKWLKFSTKKMLLSRYWIIKENFTREELHTLWKIGELEWYSVEAEIENDIQSIAEFEESL